MMKKIQLLDKNYKEIIKKMTKGKVKYYKNLPRKILIRYTKPSVVKSVVPHTMISAGSGHGKDMFGEGLITQKVGK